MNVRPISLTQPMPWLQAEGIITAENLLIYEARVSNPENQFNTATEDKLIRHLIDNKHWSPFGMINLTVEVTTSKAIGIQILRHFSISPQEFSQRYAEVMNIEPISIRKKGSTNRQSSLHEFDPLLPDPFISHHTAASVQIEEYLAQGMRLYKNLLAADVAKECARMILPMATSTTMYLNGSLRSWIHYLEQRTSLHAQLEHREVAFLIENIFIENFPMVAKALGLEPNIINP